MSIRRLLGNPVRHECLRGVRAWEARVMVKGLYKRRRWTYELASGGACFGWVILWVAVMNGLVLFLEARGWSIRAGLGLIGSSVFVVVWYVFVFGGGACTACAVYRAMMNRELDRAVRENLCLHCGYCREGLDEDAVCPECGRARVAGD